MSLRATMQRLQVQRAKFLHESGAQVLPFVTAPQARSRQSYTSRLARYGAACRVGRGQDSGMP
eukprot:15443706-Alexandrium_andersonii.AAC.1